MMPANPMHSSSLKRRQTSCTAIGAPAYSSGESIKVDTHQHEELVRCMEGKTHM